MTLRRFLLLGTLALATLAGAAPGEPSAPLALNDRGYFAKRGLNVMLASDYYPESHQGGVGIIQNGLRTATNGDLRLSPTPGQWQPTPVTGERTVDAATQQISVRMHFPDEKKNRTGFNPIDYPDLKLDYTVRVTPAGGDAFRIIVDLAAPLPADWVGQVGFNLELFPGYLFGKSFLLGGQAGLFPLQANSPAAPALGDDHQVVPLGRGPVLTIAPESEAQRLSIEAVRGGELLLLDGRARHNNGWFVVRSLVAAGATTGAIEWLVTPHAIPGWTAEPVIQVSQVGYHPRQPKVAVIELDPNDAARPSVALYRIGATGAELVREQPAQDWGNFLRSRYVQFDFTAIEQPGLYEVRYGERRSAAFPIDPQIFARHVWQPTVDYFLPVQMCHMRVNDNYRVWHGLCHDDDALMAPAPHNHFDGYAQGPSTLTRFQPGDHVPGLNHGGWHDAGDYDLRVESQADTIHGLALAWELFRPEHDNTTIDQARRLVDIHRPDGKPDLLQQIEHGALSIVGGYQALGRLYRGIIEPSLRPYAHLGDAATMNDQQVFVDDAARTAQQALAAAAVHGSQAEPVPGLPPLGTAGSPDDRWVFTEDNPDRELIVAAGLAAASRALRGYNDPLAADCRRIAEELWTQAGTPRSPLARLAPAIDLLQTTGDQKYADAIVGLADLATRNLVPDAGTDERRVHAGWLVARSLALVPDPAYQEKIRGALRSYRTRLAALEQATPYGVTYQPDIWGAGWAIQRFGVEQYFLHTGAPDIFPATAMHQALAFILGCHPGSNTASYVSGVGARSLTTAYGVNRGDWSHIPGGVASGTALIRPDFPELLTWPFLWQQTEYCLGRPTSDYVFLVLAADHLLKP
ncbi:hypothetical protein Verru16b_01165 [Lacunisphaera limnophila]|uniref:Uncharacterized protein n=1 Tax=Lacunisphaera limnophila TaxID=1838286 RepID=A0A1D8AT81_9BACT|nr:glycoside hydrolase family 9 protein [Lacunisphaera limnophila]AOS44104.1 hypothetical protein Verru16b_01165 [Lacunisphaera limnophila]